MKGNLELKPTKICKMCSSCFPSSQTEPLLALSSSMEMQVPSAQGYQRASKTCLPELRASGKLLCCAPAEVKASITSSSSRGTSTVPQDWVKRGYV